MNVPEIAVEAVPTYQPEQSVASEGKFLYSYEITIRHLGGAKCQLISRRWLITDANGQKQEVIGDGVVGQTPHLSEGKAFRYTSGCMLETPIGTMEGYYVMRLDSGEEFQVPIAPFLLAIPGTIN